MSPLIHTAALAACGIAGSYEAIDCDEAGFVAVLSSIRTGDLDGCNVTMPHKRLAHGLADELDAVARRTGAVNTVVAVGDRLVGHNTDVIGIVRTARQAGLPEDTPVMVLGAGGAAAAALLAFEGRKLSLSARRPEAAGAVAERVGVPADVVDFGSVLDGAVVVNATPVGMHGETLPVGVLEAASGFFEMPYGPVPTPSTTLARNLGIPVAVGIEMLLAQALEAFRLWTGMMPPVDLIRAALGDRVRSTEG